LSAPGRPVAISLPLRSSGLLISLLAKMPPPSLLEKSATITWSLTPSTCEVMAPLPEAITNRVSPLASNCWGRILPAYIAFRSSPYFFPNPSSAAIQRGP